MYKRLVSMLLAMLLVFGMLPTQALAMELKSSSSEDPAPIAEGVNVAEVDGTGYETLKAAFDAAATATSKTVTLLQDITLTETVYIDNGSCILDLSGHVITLDNGAGLLVQIPYFKDEPERSSYFTVKDSGTGGKITTTAATVTSTTNAVYVYSGIFNLESGTIENNFNNSYDWGTCAVQTSGTGTFNMTGGTVINNENSGYAVYNRGGITNISGGTVKNAATGGYSVVNWETTDCNISGNAVIENQGGTIFSNIGTATITVSGGTFSDNITSVSGVVLAEGTALVPNEDGTYSVKESAPSVTYVAEIVGGEKYETLQEAIDAATNGSEIKLLENITIDEGVYFEDEGAYTLNLNEKKITLTGEDFAIENYSDELTIKGNGSVYAEKGVALYNGYTGEITVENGTFESGYNGQPAVASEYGGTVKINGGTFTGNGDGIENGSECTLIVTGGTITGVGNAGITNYGGSVSVSGENTKITGAVAALANDTDEAEGTVTVSGGSFSHAIPAEYCAEGYIPAYDETTGTHTVKVGAYVAEVDGVGYENFAEAVAVWKENGGELKLLNSVKTADRIVLKTADEYVLELNGHTVDLTSKDIYVSSGKKLTIQDAVGTGKITSKYTNSNAVVSGSGASTTVILNGGTVENTGGKAALGTSISGSVLTVNGGTVKGIILIKYTTLATVTAGDLSGATVQLKESTAQLKIYDAVTVPETENWVTSATEGYIVTSERNDAEGFTTYSMIVYVDPAEAAAMLTVGDKVTYYTSAADAQKDIVDGAKLTLLEDVVADAISGVVKLDKAVSYTIDLNGHSWYNMQNRHLIHLASTDKPIVITITDTSTEGEGGWIGNSNSAYEVIYTESTTSNITINVEGRAGISGRIHIRGNNNTVNVKDNAWVESYNEYAIVINGIESTNIKINIEDNAKVVSADTEGAAIYFPGTGEINVSEDAYIEGPTGIEIRAGKLNVTGGTIIGNGEFYESDNGSGMTVFGVGIAVSQHVHGAVDPALEVNISGDPTVTGTKYAVYEKDFQNDTGRELITMSVTGGTFNADTTVEGAEAVSSENITGFIGMAEDGTAPVFSTAIPAEYCAEGYIPAYDETTGTHTVKVGTYVAMVNGAGYEDIDTALTEWATVGGELKLLNDVTSTATKLYTLTAGTEYTLDLNGHILNAPAVKSFFTVKGTLTVKDSATGGTLQGNASQIINMSGTAAVLNIESGTVAIGTPETPFSGSAYVIYFNGTLNQTGGKIYANTTGGSFRGISANSSSRNISLIGGELDFHVSYDSTSVYGIYAGSGTYTVNKLENYKITGENDLGSAYGMSCSGFKNPTIKNCTVNISVSESTTQRDSAYGISSMKSGTLEDNNVTVSGYSINAIYATNAAVEILSGNYTNISSYSTITVKGGTFDNDPSKWVPAGYKVDTEAIPGKYVVVVDPDPTMVAELISESGTTQYFDINAAIADAVDGDTVKLIEDIDLGTFSITVNKAITLDLNGHSVSGTAIPLLTVAVGDINKKVIITDSAATSAENAGSVNGYVKFSNSGDLTLEKITVNVTGTSATAIDAGSSYTEKKLTVKGARINFEYTGGNTTEVITTYKTTLTIQDIEGFRAGITHKLHKVTSGPNYMIEAGTTSPITISGGRFVMESGYSGSTKFIYLSSATVSLDITGGEFVATAVNNATPTFALLHLYGDSTTKITDGFYDFPEGSTLITVYKTSVPATRISGGLFKNQPDVASLAVGYIVKESGNADYPWTVEEDLPIKVGDTNYASIQAALDAMSAGTETGTEITLLRDLEVSTMLTVPAGVNATLNKGEFNVTFTAEPMVKLATGAEMPDWIDATQFEAKKYSSTGDTYYKSFKDMAMSGTITLLKDVSVGDKHDIQVASNMTLNLGDYTITGTAVVSEENNIVSLFWVYMGTTTINAENGGINTPYMYNFNVRKNSSGFYNAKLIINGGNYFAFTSCVQVDSGDLEINGGNFDVNNEDKHYLINCIDANYQNESATVTISGGTFNGFDPANSTADSKDGQNADLCAEGKDAYYDTKGNYIVLNDTSVAMVNGVGYETLQAALDAANADNTVKLLADIEGMARYIIRDGKSVTIDLNGHTISSGTTSGCFGIITGGDLTLTGTGTVKEGDGFAYYAPIIYQCTGSTETSVITVGENVTLEGWCGIFVSRSTTSTVAPLVVNVNGTVKSVKDSYGTMGGAIYVHGEIINHENVYPVININETAVLDGTSEGIAVHGAGYAEWNIKGTATGATAIHVQSGVLNVMEGAVVTAVGEYCEYEPGNSNATATGDAIVSDNCGYPGGAPVVNIYGGTITSANGKQIGAYYGNTATEIGTVISTNTSLTVPDGYEWNAEGKLVEKKEPVKFAGTSMVLGSDLKMNFWVKAADFENRENYYAKITKSYADNRPSKEVTVDGADWEVRDSYYGMSFDGIAAKEMSDNVNVKIYLKGTEGAEDTLIIESNDSVRGYAMRTLNNPATTSELLKTTVVDMLNYGAAAQEHFGYNVNDLANSQLTDAQKAYATTEDIEMADIRENGANFAGTSLFLESKISLTLYFSGITAPNGMTAKIIFTDHYDNVKEFTIEGKDFIKNGSFYGVKIDKLAVADMSTLVTCTVYNADGSEYGSAKDSIESYLARGGEGEIYTAIMKFATAAYSYFHIEDSAK